LDNQKNNENKLELLIDFDYGSTVSVAGLYPNNDHFLILKECGSVQLWNIKKSVIVNRLNLNEKVVNYLIFM
jgi:hypothetical protein